MPKEPVSVHKIKEILRLRELGLSERDTATHCGVSHGAVGDYTRRARLLGLTVKSLESMTDGEVWALFTKRTSGPQRDEKRMPDYAQIREEMTHKGMTLQYLWEQYHAEDPDTAYRYTQFCEYYRRFVRTLDVRMRFEHRAGEKLFIDYSGVTMPIWDPSTGEVAFQAEIWVGVLGASGFTYAEATRSQRLEDWIGSHERAFRYFGGVPLVWVPDNLKSAVTKAHPHTPEINRTYRELAAHHGAVVQPARARKPRDKALAENGVQLVQRWILIALRNVRFYDLDSLNVAIRELLVRYNDRKLRNLPYTRRELFEKLDKPALLPVRPGYSYGRWAVAKVNPQYCVRVEKKYYSVPYTLVGRKIDARVGALSVEVYHDGVRVAVHGRLHGDKVYAVKREHMPPNHQAMMDESEEQILSWARTIGNATAAYIEAFIGVRPIAMQAFGPAKGILSLGRRYGYERLEEACRLAHELRRYRKQDVETILRRGRDKQTRSRPELALPQGHPNVRGGNYYH